MNDAPTQGFLSMSDPDRIVIVLTTVGADIDPATIALRLIEERLAACVNALPEMESFFRWHGAVERDRERQLLIKTTAARLPALEERLHDMHPYDLPEFVVLPGERASAAYARWVRNSTAPNEGAGDGEHDESPKRDS
jgi:periplasmic divalent cation tolerance protein